MSRLSGWRCWEQLTTNEFAGLDPATTVALLPVAAVEQHGPHLPLGTDALIADAIVDAALARAKLTGVLLRLPTQRIGLSPEHETFPGTLSVPAEVLLQAWVAIGHGVARAGIRKLVLFNTHGGQTALIDLVAQRLRREARLLVVRCSYFRFGPPSRFLSERERRFGWHGGTRETSLMLRIAPALVREEHIADFPSAAEAVAAANEALAFEGGSGIGWLAEDLNRDGAVGDATMASAKTGEAFLEFYADRLACLITEVERVAVPF